MAKLKNTFILFLFFALLLAGCSEHPLPEPEAPELTKKINSFIKIAMEDVYLWYDKLPNIDIRYEFDPNVYFKKLLFEEDKWSFLTDDVAALEASFEGVETTFG